MRKVNGFAPDLYILKMLSDGGMEVREGKVTSASVLLKGEDEIVVMPQAKESKRYAAHNPLLFAGKFFSSRIKQDGHVSLHAIINGEKAIDEVYQQARFELDEFFNRLNALL